MTWNRKSRSASVKTDPSGSRMGDRLTGLPVDLGAIGGSQIHDEGLAVLAIDQGMVPADLGGVDDHVGLLGSADQGPVGPDLQRPGRYFRSGSPRPTSGPGTTVASQVTEPTPTEGLGPIVTVTGPSSRQPRSAAWAAKAFESSVETRSEPPPRLAGLIRRRKWLAVAGTGLGLELGQFGLPGQPGGQFRHLEAAPEDPSGEAVEGVLETTLQIVGRASS